MAFGDETIFRVSVVCDFGRFGGVQSCNSDGSVPGNSSVAHGRDRSLIVC